MTLEEYKAQTKEIMEEMNNFQGDDEQLAKLLEDLAKKYPELNEFNQKATECADLESFVKLAKSYGMEFSSEESIKILFDSLKKSPETLTKIANGELDDEALDMVTGGKLSPEAKIKLKKIVGVILGAAGSAAFAAATMGTGIIASIALFAGMASSISGAVSFALGWAEGESEY